MSKEEFPALQEFSQIREENWLKLIDLNEEDLMDLEYQMRCSLINGFNSGRVSSFEGFSRIVPDFRLQFKEFMGEFNYMDTEDLTKGERDFYAIQWLCYMADVKHSPVLAGLLLSLREEGKEVFDGCITHYFVNFKINDTSEAEIAYALKTDEEKNQGGIRSKYFRRHQDITVGWHLQKKPVPPPQKVIDEINKIEKLYPDFRSDAIRSLLKIDV
jgi:hypothetical protein